MRTSLKHILSVTLVALALSPVTEPFSTFDLTGHSGDSPTHEALMLAAKMSAGEDVAMAGAPPAADTAAPVFVLVGAPAVADETSKHQIPSRILRL